MAGRLTSKTALITGGSQGMGRSFAERFAADGAAHVIVTYRSGQDEARTAARAVEDLGSKVHLIQADLARTADIARLFEELDRALAGARLDILVANASAPMVTEPLHEVDEDAFDGMMAVNARATFLLLKGAIPRLADGGRVIGMSTPYVERAEAGRGVVAASKAALQALVLSVAKEQGHRGITANVVMPGATETESFKAQVPKEFHDQIVAQTPLGRLGRPEDVADVVAFLASNDARWITGQVLKAGGGLI